MSCDQTIIRINKTMVKIPFVFHYSGKNCLEMPLYFNFIRCD